MNFLKRGMLIGLSTAMVAVLLLLLRVSPASAQTCVQDEFGKSVQCTANDVRVAAVTNIRDLSGNNLASCIAGSTFSFIADFTVVTSSTSSRSNIGLYFATDPQQAGGAITGSCDDAIIPPTHPCPGNTSITCGSDHYDEFDPAPDNCGDSSSSDPGATQHVTIEVDNFKCNAPPGATSLPLPNCTSWQVPGKTIQCVSPGPSFPWVPAAIPGSPSKCNCGTIALPITVQSPMASVTKTCDVGALPNTDNNPNALCTGNGAPFACCTGAGTGSGTGACGATSCSLHPEGGSVTYRVDIVNSSNFGNIIVDQICDSAYGNIFTAGTFTGPACPAGSQCTAPNNVAGATCNTGTTCSALSIDGTPGSCTFTASQGENKTVTDTVNVTGHGASAGKFGPDASNSVQVQSGEAASTATVTKGLVGTQAGCATVRYSVDVNDTSTLDEVLSLSAFNDSAYGSITSVHDSVLGTTCGVATASAGLGTLSGSAGAGALPATIAVGGHYTCQFDAQFCGPLVTITLPNGSTCSGIQHVNKVTGTLAGDEGETVTQTGNTFTVDECFTTTTSSTTP